MLVRRGGDIRCRLGDHTRSVRQNTPMPSRFDADSHSIGDLGACILRGNSKTLDT